MIPTIREAVPDDLPQVHRMLALLNRQPGDIPLMSLEALHHQTFDLDQARIWVAAEPEGLVGCALVLRRRNRVTGRIGHELIQIFVDEWRRHAGIGRALVAAAQARARAEAADFRMADAHPARTGPGSAERTTGPEDSTPPGPQLRIALG